MNNRGQFHSYTFLVTTTTYILTTYSTYDKHNVVPLQVSTYMYLLLLGKNTIPAFKAYLPLIPIFRPFSLMLSSICHNLASFYYIVIVNGIPLQIV